MKSITAIIFLTFFATVSGRAQSGVYLSAADYDHNKLTATPDGGRKQCIRLNELLNLRHITVISGGRKQTFPKDSIFGFKTCDEITYRIFRKESYQLLNNSHALILYKQSLVQGGKGLHTATSFYFSKDAGAPLLPLTKENLAAAFANDTAFTEHVISLFNTDEDLMRYDARRKAYQLSVLYQQYGMAADHH